MPQYFIQQRLSERISETPQGFLLCEEVPIARTGTQEYLAREIGLDELPPNTVVTVERREADVMNAAVLASFEGVTVTLGHPSEQVTRDNWRSLSMGHLQNIRRGTGDMAHLILADMLITDPTTIAQVRGGLREVSCGYDCQYVQDEDGQWRQTEIRGNHVAIVPRGRAGPECSIKDSIMSKAIDKIRSIWARATDEATNALAAAETAVAVSTTFKGMTIDEKTFKVTLAADADISGIVADLVERLAYMERNKKEVDEMVDGLKAAISKLSEGDASAAADAATNPPATPPATPPAPPAAVTDAAIVARAEILAPGIAMIEGVELAALTAAYATADGKKIIDLLNGGKAPTADTAAQLFVSASELIKAQRAAALTPARDADKKVVVDAIATINAKSKELHPLY